MVKSPVAAVLVLCSAFVRADDWPPPRPAELAIQAPEIEPEADAEALLWDVRIAHDLVEGSARTEQWQHLRMKLPEGFAVDEMPRPSKGEAAFGSHSSSCEVADGYLTCLRTVSVSAAIIPVELYKEARDFFAWVNSAGDEPVVLSRTAAAH